MLQDAAAGLWWFCLAPKAAIKHRLCCFSASCRVRNDVAGLAGPWRCAGLGWVLCSLPGAAAAPLRVSSAPSRGRDRLYPCDSVCASRGLALLPFRGHRAPIGELCPVSLHCCDVCANLRVGSKGIRTKPVHSVFGGGAGGDLGVWFAFIMVCV